MTIFLGVLSAVFIGFSDTLGRFSTRRANAISHIATAMAIAIVLTLAGTLVVDSQFLRADVLSGAVSGIFMSAGLGVVYRGMADTSAAIVSPISAVFAALGPLAWDIAFGLRPSLIVSLGCGLAIAALALTTFNPDLGDRAKLGLFYGVGGGLLFAAGIISVADTSEASGVWPVVAQRVVGCALMVSIALKQKLPVVLPGSLLKFGLLSGLCGGLGMMAWTVGAQRGDLGVVSVTASMYPAFVALLAAKFDDDQLHWWQGIGIAITIGALALIALG